MSRTRGERGESKCPDDSLSGTVLSGGAWLGMAAASQAFLQILIVAVLARLLTPTDFGQFAIAVIIMDLATGLAGTGVSQAVVQRGELTDHHIRAAFSISFLLGVLTSSAVVALSPWLASLLGDPTSAPLIAALSATFIIRAVAFVPEGLTVRSRNFRVLAMRKAGAYLVGYGIVGIGAALLGAGPWALVLAEVASALAEAILLLNASRFEWRPTAKWSAHREIIGFGSGMSLARIANALCNQSDRAIVAKFTDPAAVGLYTRAVQITRYPTALIGQAVEDVLFPSFAGLQTSRERLKGAYYRSIGSIFMIMVPVSVFFCVSAGMLSSVLLGSQWGGVVPLMATFGVSIPFRSAQRISTSLLLAIGRSWLIAALQILLLTMTIIGVLVGIRHGLMGAAVAVTIALIVHYVALASACAYALRLDVSQLLLRHLAGCRLGVVALVGSGGGVILSRNLPAGVALVISMSTTLILAAVVVYFMPRGTLGSDGQWLAAKLFARLPAKLAASSACRRFALRITRLI